MWDFFISHSSIDKEAIVDALVKSLEGANLSVWYDKKDILTGDNIVEQVTKGLNKSLCLILILTANFIKSKWVYLELGQFSVFQKRRIIPIIYDLSDDEKLEITRMLGNLKYIDALSLSISEIVYECKKALDITKSENEELVIKIKLNNLKKTLNTFENINADILSLRLKEYCEVYEEHPQLAVFCAKKIIATMVTYLIKYIDNSTNIEENDLESIEEIVKTKNIFNLNIREQIEFVLKSDNMKASSDYIMIINKSVINILTWYIHTRYAMHLNYSDRIEIAFPTELTYEDFVDMEGIDRMVLRDDLIADANIVYNQWYLYNCYTHIALRDRMTRKIIGYFSILPITDETYAKILSGDFKDKDFSSDDLRQYIFSDFYRLYIAAVAIHPDYQNTNAFIILYNALVELLLNLAKEREVYISEIIAEASTKQGEKLCKIVGMKKKTKTIYNTDVYSVVLIPPEFRIWNRSGKELLKLCQQKYEEYREYFD